MEPRIGRDTDLRIRKRHARLSFLSVVRDCLLCTGRHKKRARGYVAVAMSVSVAPAPTRFTHDEMTHRHCCVQRLLPKTRQATGQLGMRQIERAGGNGSHFLRLGSCADRGT